MNYRHAFHAGNFADVFKHLVLMRVLDYLAQKPKPFRVVDTHAGAGLYHLASQESLRGGEWQSGYGRLAGFSPPQEAAAIFRPYLDALSALCRGGTHYPGSPLLIRHALRAQDHACFNELLPESYAQLRKVMPRDERLTFTELNGYTVWKAQIPPPERRGLVLVDPPFEVEDEFLHLLQGFREMVRKWPTGIAMVWYPIKNRETVNHFEDGLIASGAEKLLVLELHVADLAREGGLAACGLALLNPPYPLEQEMRVALPPLAQLLARDQAAGFRVEMLTKM